MSNADSASGARPEQMSNAIEELAPSCSGLSELPSPADAFEWAHAASRAGQKVDAARRWAILRAAYPTHPATWLQAAYAHIEGGEYAQAESLLAHARTAFKSHPSTLLHSAELAIRQGKLDLAERFLDQARQRHADQLGTWTKSAHCAELTGDVSKAEEYYVKAQELFPANPQPFIQFAELAMRQCDWAEALERWETVRKNFKELEAGYTRAAAAAHKLNDSNEARRLRLASLTRKNDSGEAEALPSYASGKKRYQPKYAAFTFIKALFNLRSEVSRSYMSYCWWIIEPLLYLSVYFLVFDRLLNRGGSGYGIFLMAGLAPWMWFMKAISASSNSIVGNQSLIIQKGVLPTVFPLINLIQVSLKQIPVFILLLFFISVLHAGPMLAWAWLIPVMAVQALLTATVACGVAGLVPLVRDLGFLVPTGLTLLMFLSGVFFDYRDIDSSWHSLFLANPIAFLLACYRDILVSGEAPPLGALAGWGAISAGGLIIILWVLRKLRVIYPRLLME